MRQMPGRDNLVLLVLGIIVAVTASAAITRPGYMDAEYYFVTGRVLSLGGGFEEPFIWNYLNSPRDVIHPSHGYWQPFTSMVAATFMPIFGPSFRAAQLPFILLTALLPLLTARYAFSLQLDHRAAFLAGLLAAVPGFFLPYFLTTDMFILYAWIGTLFFWSLHLGWQRQANLMWVASGFCVGLAHLARADGLLLALPFIYFIVSDPKRFYKRAGLALVGYLFVMMPWFLRNWSIYGAILPPGSGHTLWFRTYEDLFRYPASGLRPRYLAEAGLDSILAARLSALWTNLQRVLAENGLVFLLPLMLLGLFDRWRQRVVRSMALYWVVLILVMSFVFPFAGAQGGTFHSSAALMPTLWMLVPFGLRRAIAWVGELRDWNIPQATINFGWILVVLAAVFTSAVYLQRVYGFDQATKVWEADFETYKRLGDELRALDPPPQVVMLNNPPGFFSATGIHAVVVPSGGVNALEMALADFPVNYLVLDRNHPSGLRDVYAMEVEPGFLDFVQELEIGRASPILIFRVLAQAGVK